LRRFVNKGTDSSRFGATGVLLCAVLALAACAGAPTQTGDSNVPGAPVMRGEAAIAPARANSAKPVAPPAFGDTRSQTGVAAQSGNLWDRIRSGFAFPELQTPLVAEKERWYLSKPEYLRRMFGRGERYLFYIVEELEKRGMPTELALLPFVESAMNPTALSPAQAAGLWQFIPATGKRYDLEQNWWVDNRRDVVKSTQAALDYLQAIYVMHGNDWFLALASYNWGENAVARAVKKNQQRGRPTDYVSLDMPAETRNYVPKLVALKNIVLHARELGIALPDLPNRPYFVTIEKTRPIDLKLAAQFANMSVDEFVALNPAHNRPVIAASRNNGIKLPADRVDAFLAAIERHEQSRKAFATWQPYTLKRGETIDAVAHRGGVRRQELLKANGLRESQNIVAGTRILAPHEEVADESGVEAFVAPRVYEEVDRPAVYHTVGRSESLGSIASRYGVSQTLLAAWNGIKRGVSRGMRLLVKPPASQTLLTDESGERQIVASHEKPPAAVRASLPEAAPEAPAPEAHAAKKHASSSAKHAEPAHRAAHASSARKATSAGRGQPGQADRRATSRPPDRASGERRAAPA
jgi:membrane-bound lytic murein transglycosylase D